jgi:hypothetical protein
MYTDQSINSAQMRPEAGKPCARIINTPEHCCDSANESCVADDAAKNMCIGSRDV